MALTINTNIINDADNYTADAKQIKGGYVTVSTIAERDALPAATTINGSLCYVTATDKFYQYNGTSWAEKSFGGGAWGEITGTLSDQEDLQEALDAKENTSNKTTALSASSTDTQYPSAKAVYDGANVEIVQSAITNTGLGLESDVRNKITVTWDGDASDKLSLPLDEWSSEIWHYRASEIHLDHTKFVGAVGKWSTESDSFVIDSSMIEQYDDDVPIYIIYDSDGNDAIYLVEKDTTVTGERIFSGIYFGEHNQTQNSYIELLSYSGAAENGGIGWKEAGNIYEANWGGEIAEGQECIFDTFYKVSDRAIDHTLLYDGDLEWTEDDQVYSTTIEGSWIYYRELPDVPIYDIYSFDDEEETSTVRAILVEKDCVYDLQSYSKGLYFNRTSATSYTDFIYSMLPEKVHTISDEYIDIPRDKLEATTVAELTALNSAVETEGIGFTYPSEEIDIEWDYSFQGRASTPYDEGLWKCSDRAVPLKRVQNSLIEGHLVWTDFEGETTRKSFSTDNIEEGYEGDDTPTYAIVIDDVGYVVFVEKDYVDDDANKIGSGIYFFANHGAFEDAYGYVSELYLNFDEYVNKISSDYVDTSGFIVQTTGTATDKAMSQNVVTTALGTKEDTSNKVTSMSASSTDAQYPSAKATYTALSGKSDTDHTHTIPSMGMGLGVSSSALGSAIYVVTLSEFVLTAGALLTIRFTNGFKFYSTTSNNTYLNVNSTGKKLICFRNSSSGRWLYLTISAGSYMTVVYNGVNFEIIATSDYGSRSDMLSYLEQTLSAAAQSQVIANLGLTTKLNNMENITRKVTSMSASSTDTQYPSAKAVYDADQVLQTEIENLKSIGRFLAVMDASAGTVSSQPSGSVGDTYSYKVGDYYRIGAAGTYTPKGNAVYTIDSTSGSSNFEVGTVSYAIGDVLYCSNLTETTSTWVLQKGSGGGTVQDVTVNGTSVLEGGIAKVVVPTKTSDLTNDSGFITSSAITGKEDTANKTTTLSSSSTDTQYPSAKAVYDGANVATVQNAITNSGIGYTTTTGGETISITWDGDTTGKTECPLDNPFGDDPQHYLISTNHPDHTQLVGATVRWSDSSESFTLTSSMIVLYYEGTPAYDILDTNSIIIGHLVEEDFSVEGISATAGIYLGKYEESGRYIASFAYSGETETTDHQIAAKYLQTALSTKVDKVTGKGLSTNDYTTAEKTLVASAIQPNDNVSELTNDAGYITSSAISGKEDVSNKVTTLSASSTDTQYPSAKVVYDNLSTKVDKETGKELAEEFTSAEITAIWTEVFGS